MTTTLSGSTPDLDLYTSSLASSSLSQAQDSSTDRNHLLGLPSEVRELIYTHFLSTQQIHIKIKRIVHFHPPQDGSGRFRRTYSGRLTWTPSPAVVAFLSTCRQVFQESKHLLLNHAGFHFIDDSLRPPSIVSFLPELGTRLQSIQAIGHSTLTHLYNSTTAERMQLSQSLKFVNFIHSFKRGDIKNQWKIDRLFHTLDNEANGGDAQKVATSPKYLNTPYEDSRDSWSYTHLFRSSSSTDQALACARSSLDAPRSNALQEMLWSNERYFEIQFEVTAHSRDNAQTVKFTVVLPKYSCSSQGGHGHSPTPVHVPTNLAWYIFSTGLGRNTVPEDERCLYVENLRLVGRSDVADRRPLV